MTKILVTILMLFLFSTVSGQKKKEIFNFSHTYYNFDGTVFKVDKKALSVDTILDIQFYRQNFYKPYHFPQKFIDKRYKNQALEIWNDTTKAKGIQSNWSYTYVYDSLSRVILYGYSSCLICGQQPFNIQISYDFKNRPNRFSIRHSFGRNLPESEGYEFIYDNKGNIIRVNYVSGGRLTEQIAIK